MNLTALEVGYRRESCLIFLVDHIEVDDLVDVFSTDSTVFGIRVG